MRLPLGLTAVLVVLALPAASAEAAPTCAYTNGTVTAAGHPFLNVLADKRIQLGGTDCGAATTDNTTLITLDTQSGSSVGASVSITLDAPLAGASGQPIDVQLTKVGSFTLEDRTDRGTTTVVTTDGAGRPAIELGGDDAPDITYTDTLRFRTVVLRMGPGADVLTDTATKDSNGYPRVDFAGGPGADTLTVQRSDQLLHPSATGPLKMRADLGGTEAGFDGFGSTDTYRGLAEADHVTVEGTGFADVLRGGVYATQLVGLAGDDEFRGVLDNTAQTLQCGEGTDTGVADDADVKTGCEFSDPPTATLSSDATSVHEGDEIFATVTLDAPLPFDQTFSLAGLPLEDFFLESPRATIPAGALTATIPVWGRSDSVAEAAETATAQLDRSGGSLAARIGTPNSFELTVLDGAGPSRAVPAGTTASRCADGSVLAGVAAQIYTKAWDSDLEPNGVLTLAARCRDAAGTVTTAGFYPDFKTYRTPQASSCAADDPVNGVIFKIAPGNRPTSGTYVGTVGIGCTSGDGPLLGTAGTALQRSECPAGDPAVGVEMTTGEPEDFSYYVGTVATICRSGLVVGKPPTTDTPTNTGTTGGTTGGTGATPRPPLVLPPPIFGLFSVKVDELTGKRRGRLRFIISHPGTVVVGLSTLRNGRRSGGKCRTTARRGKKCTITTKLGKPITKSFAAAGPHSVTLSPKKALKPGRYQLTVRASSAGKAGPSKTITFTVKKG